MDIPLKFKKRKSPVTIIVGIICENAIVLASDSQTTSGTAKRTDTEKITTVEFSNLTVLVAQSGYATFSGQAIEIFSAIAKGKEITDYKMVAEIAGQAMRKLKDNIRFQQGDCTVEELRDYVWKHEMGCELMLAYYFDGKPYLFTIDMIIGIANRINSTYDAIGCGANLGIYLLSEFVTPNMSFGHATVVAVYAVEIVKKNDAFCGGKTKLGVLHTWHMYSKEILEQFNDGKNYYIQMFSEKEIDDLSKIAAWVDEMGKATRDRDILRILLERTKREREQMESDIKKILGSDIEPASTEIQPLKKENE